MNLGIGLVARVAAWAVAAGASAAVVIGYDSLPDTIPVTRWTDAPKSPFVALRVPLINLLTLGLIEVLSPSLRRATGFKRADSVVAVLLLTAAAKAGIEAAGILTLPVSFSWTPMPLMVVLTAGIGTAAFLSRELLHPQGWRALKMTRLESAGSLALINGIVILNLPLVIQ